MEDRCDYCNRRLRRESEDRKATYLVCPYNDCPGASASGPAVFEERTERHPGHFLGFFWVPGHASIGHGASFRTRTDAQSHVLKHGGSVRAEWDDKRPR